MAGVFESAMETLGLTPRAQQQNLVNLAREAVRGGEVRIVQAGTGVGKSYAVLTVALEAARASGLPSVVICPNNTLINQYVTKDAPSVSKAVGGTFVYLKGRSRYLCANSRGLSRSGGGVAEYARLVEQNDGQVEWAEIAGLDASYGCPGSPDCSGATSRPCSGHPPLSPCNCKYVCGALRARFDAQTADVVVTNAHVLMWDFRIRQMSGGQVALLPDPGAIFVDECHELEGIGRDVLSTEIKPTNPVYSLLPDLQRYADSVEQDMRREDKSEATFDAQGPEFQALVKEAESEARYREGLASQHDAGDELAKQYLREVASLDAFAELGEDHDDFITTVTLAHPEGVVFNRRCVDANLTFRRILVSNVGASVLVSGTIPDSEPKRLGLGKTPIDNVGHPFDYSRSTLAISQFSAKDRTATYSRAQQVAAAINDTGGGTLILFTSWKDLEEAVPLIVMNLRPEIAAEVYIQDREDPTLLAQDIEDFKAHGDAVLIGVKSLFTGLDVPGRALRQVVMWKVPYGVPTLEAKAIERKFGRQTYWDAMKCVLVQGVGRLVRTTEDSGRVFIADSRANGIAWAESQLTRHMLEFSAHRRPR